MFNRSSGEKKSIGAKVPTTITSQSNSKPKQGRERLKYFADGAANANAAVEDLQERIARFENIIADA
jgi:ubiquinone biosynthesis protein UbiJ